MANKFQEYLEELRDARSKFAPTQFPLYNLENLSAQERTNLLRLAESKFSSSANQSKNEFYRCLFDVLSEEGLSNSDGDEAKFMHIVYQNAIKLFPRFAAIEFKSQFYLMKEACKNTKSDEKYLKGYAMNMFFVLYKKHLDTTISINVEGAKGRQTYTKLYQNCKKLEDSFTGKVYIDNYPTWATFCSADGCKKTFLSSAIWEMLTEETQ